MYLYAGVMSVLMLKTLLYYTVFQHQNNVPKLAWLSYAVIGDLVTNGETKEFLSFLESVHY